MFLKNILKNINKKSILYSISTVNISTIFGMNNNNILNDNTLNNNILNNNILNNNSKYINIINNKIQININDISEEDSCSFLSKKKIGSDNNLSAHKIRRHDKNYPDIIRKRLFVRFSYYLLDILNDELEKVNKKCDFFKDVDNLKNNISFKNFKSLCTVELVDIYDLLSSKLGYYCITNARNDHNKKLVYMCILCEKTCKNLCDIFCSYGYEIYEKFLNSEFYDKIVIDTENEDGKSYAEKFSKISIDILENFKKSLSFKLRNSNINRFINKNIDDNLKNFFEERKNFYDNFFYKGINLDEDKEINLGEDNEKILNISLKDQSIKFINIFEKKKQIFSVKKIKK